MSNIAKIKIFVHNEGIIQEVKKALEEIRTLKQEYEDELQKRYPAMSQAAERNMTLRQKELIQEITMALKEIRTSKRKIADISDTREPHTEPILGDSGSTI